MTTMHRINVDESIFIIFFNIDSDLTPLISSDIQMRMMNERHHDNDAASDAGVADN